MKSEGLSGLMPILATPFSENAELDVKSLARVVEFQLESRVDGVAVFGMASEGFAISRAERSSILEVVAEVAGDKFPIVAGVNGTSSANAIEQGKEALDGGACALMVLPPFMVKPDSSQVRDFYSEVAAATKAPVMVQDAPGVTGVTMSVDQILELSRLEFVSSVKVESPPTFDKVASLNAALKASEFAVFGGNNAQFCVQEYSAGASGTMPACEIADLVGGLLRILASGEVGEARREWMRLLPLLAFGSQTGIAWEVHKEVLVYRGIIDSAAVRSPAKRMSSATRRLLHDILEDLDLPDLDAAVKSTA